MTDWFDVQGAPVGVRTTSHAFGAWLRHALAAHVMDGSDLDDDDARYSVVVEDDPGLSGARCYHLLYDGMWNIVRTLDVGAVARSLLSEIDARTAPARDDAVFVQAALLRLGERTILVPATLIQPTSPIWRRLGRRMEVGLPEGMTVAVDPRTGRLVRPDPVLRIATDREAELADLFTFPAAPDVRNPAHVDTVVLWAADPGPVVRPGSRAAAVITYTRSVRNAAQMGSASVRALAMLLAEAECVEVSYSTDQEAVRVFDALAEGRGCSEDRREVTPRALGGAQVGDLGSNGARERAKERSR